MSHYKTQITSLTDLSYDDAAALIQYVSECQKYQVACQKYQQEYYQYAMAYQAQHGHDPYAQPQQPVQSNVSTSTTSTGIQPDRQS